MSKPNNEWLYAEDTFIPEAWFVMIHAGDGAEEPGVASLFWPKGLPLLVPNKMVLMSVAAFTDLVRRATPPAQASAMECP